MAILIFASCKKPIPNTDYAAKADCTVLIDSLNTYTKSVGVIFNARCAYSPCHDANTAKHKVMLNNYSNVVAAVNKYPTRFLCAIHQDRGTPHMPKKSPMLPDSLITKIDCWVKGGMKE